MLEFENGYWNRISAADVHSELQGLPELARQKAAESGLAGEAEKSLEQQLGARVHISQPLHVVFARKPAAD